MLLIDGCDGSVRTYQDVLVAIVKLSKAGEKKKKRNYLQWQNPLLIYLPAGR
jgi:hypothetical protein